MITTLIFDFAQVICFSRVPDATLISLQQRSHQTKKPITDFVSYNHDLLTYLKQIRTQYRLLIFSATAPNLLSDLTQPFQDVFLHVFSAQELKMSKNEATSYIHLAQKIQTTPEEIIFTDDKRSNVSAAQQAGYYGIVFNTTPQWKKDFHQLV